MAVTIVLTVVIAAAVVAGVVHFRRTVRSGCCGAGGGDVRISPQDSDKSHYPYRTVLRISGMSCENCAVRVRNALNLLKGVNAAVRLRGGRADVLSKDPPDVAALCGAVRRAGYGAEPEGRPVMRARA